MFNFFIFAGFPATVTRKKGFSKRFLYWKKRFLKGFCLEKKVLKGSWKSYKINMNVLFLIVLHMNQASLRSQTQPDAYNLCIFDPLSLILIKNLNNLFLTFQNANKRTKILCNKKK